MLILIYGEDTYRSRAWLRELEDKFRAKFDAQGYNTSRFAEDAELEEIAGALRAPPFLASRRMVAIERGIEKGSKNDVFAATLFRVPESTVCVLWEEGGENDFAKNPLFAKVARAKDTKTYPFPVLRDLELEKWAYAEAQKRGIDFARGALRTLVLRVGPDLWQLHSELEKCAAYGGVITETTVNELVRGKTTENIFRFVDALAARDRVAAVRELANERACGTPAPYLINMLTRQCLLLLQTEQYLTEHERCTATELAKALACHPFVAKKLLVQIRHFRMNELGHITDTLFSFDRAIKKGSIDMDSALDLLMVKMVERELIV